MSIAHLRNTEDVVIGAGASLSAANAKSLVEATLVAVLLPAGWDAAKVTFQGSVDGTTFANLIDGDAGEYEVPAVTGANWVAVNPAVFVGCNYVKVRSGTAASATNQGDAVTLTLVYTLVQG